MIYQALYRKYRPKTFDEVCGQDIIIKTLKNAVKNDKINHAYLFTGPRGTGKTSIAKIFAKTINCNNVKNGCSCEECEVCRLSNLNENIDIIEMDAASNNGVDEIREIRNHVTYLPSLSKYKIYIIDEVHMLSSGAFNALLKTLEEPPKHVIFILATTEPQKVPLTIISRCQYFEFKPIPYEKMKNKIKFICDNENIKIDENAISQICEYSNGCMRDAISLLDQVNSYSDGNITSEEVSLLNGRISNDKIIELLDLIKENKVKEIFELSDKFDSDGLDYISISEDIIKYLKNILIEKQISGKKNDIVDSFGKNKITNIIFEISNYLNQMKNIKDKKIYFDLMLIKIIDIIDSEQAYVKEKEVEIQKPIINKEEKKVVIEKKEETKVEEEPVKEEVKEKTIEVSTSVKDYDNYDKLMDIRLNNILAEADKNSLKEYLSFFNKLEENLNNLDERKNYNLLQDCEIKAGSKGGIVITTSSINIIHELYDSLKEIEELFEKMDKVVKVCFYDEEKWLSKRDEYVKLIKSKKSINILDEKEIYDIIFNGKDQSKHTEFDDLLEIGE